MDENLEYFLIWFMVFILSIIFCVLSYFYSTPSTQVSLMSSFSLGFSGMNSLISWHEYIKNK